MTVKQFMTGIMYGIMSNTWALGTVLADNLFDVLLCAGATAWFFYNMYITVKTK